MEIRTRYLGTRKILFAIVFVAILIGSITELKEEMEFARTIYTGKPLKIAVVGSFPDIREENIIFEEITLPELTTMEYEKEYDALFIRREYSIYEEKDKARNKQKLISEVFRTIESLQ